MALRSAEVRRKAAKDRENGIVRIPLGADERYRITRLNRVRAQLDLIDKRIAEQANKGVIDGQTLNWLATAQARLSEQERILTGRALPGSLRPSAKNKPANTELPEPE